jgi:hypothetical protein
MLKWVDDIGYNNNEEMVAFLSYTRDKLAINVKVRGGAATDGYFVGNTVSPANAAAVAAAKQLAEVTYRIVKNQPDQDAAQVALRAYARMKGDFWWED